MENKENTPRAEPMNQTTVAIIAVVMLAVGLGAGYYLFSGGTAEAAEPVSGQPAGQERFVLDMEKVNEIEGVFEDYFYVLSEGQTTDLTYSTYNEYPGYVEIVYVLNGQEFPIYLSKDYNTLFPSILDYEDFKGEVETAKTQLESYQPEPEELEKTEEPEVLLFVMSFCPYGNVAEDAMDPVVDLLGDSMYFEPVYIVSQTGDGSWASLHGNVELNQDIREKIIYKLYGPDVWMDYVFKVNSQCDYRNADECWTGAAGELGINVTEVEEYFNDSEYVNALLAQDTALSTAYGVRGSPTLIINGKTMNVARSPESYKSAICEAYISPPEGCDSTLTEEGGVATGSC